MLLKDGSKPEEKQPLEYLSAGYRVEGELGSWGWAWMVWANELRPGSQTRTRPTCQSAWMILPLLPLGQHSAWTVVKLGHTEMHMSCFLSLVLRYYVPGTHMWGLAAGWDEWQDLAQGIQENQLYQHVRQGVFSLPQTFSRLVSCLASDVHSSYHRESAATDRNTCDRLSRRRAIIKGLHVLLSLKLLRWMHRSQATPKYMVVSAVGTYVLSDKYRAEKQNTKCCLCGLRDSQVHRRQTEPVMGSLQFFHWANVWHIRTKEWHLHP